MSELKLLPCPFCGGVAEYETSNGILKIFQHGIWCNNPICSISMIAPTDFDVIKAWNHRQNSWEPITTAPTEIDVLLYCTRGVKPASRAQIEVGWAFTKSFNGNGKVQYNKATHWQPLPAPPL